MTTREFKARMERPQPIEPLAQGREEARRRLETARQFAERAKHSAPVVRELAALELDRAKVLAEEWCIR